MGERVLLVHGLWMPGASMRWMAGCLRDAGFEPEPFTYDTVRGGPELAIPRLAARLREGRAHVLAHSLGGLVALATFQRNAGLPAGRVVCLGSPLHGSAAARGVASHRWGAFALGHSASMLRDGCEPCVDGLEVGVVAGRRSHGLGQFFAHFRGDSDGTVAVDETRIEGLADHVTVDASHFGLLVSAEAARQAVAFLRSGRFRHQPR